MHGITVAHYQVCLGMIEQAFKPERSRESHASGRNTYMKNTSICGRHPVGVSCLDCMCSTSTQNPWKRIATQVPSSGTLIRNTECIRD